MVRWAGHVALMAERRGTCRILVVYPEGRRTLGRPKRKCEDNIKINTNNTLYIIYIINFE
jgi:hypothetical protein